MHVLMHSHTVPTVSLNSAPVTATEGEAIDICATLSGIPTAGLECPVLLQLQASPSPMNSGILSRHIVQYIIYPVYKNCLDSCGRS